jgi:hypothetical protein
MTAIQEISPEQMHVPGAKNAAAAAALSTFTL